MVSIESLREPRFLRPNFHPLVLLKQQDNMNKIHSWLAQFTTAWQTHDVDAVMDLFADGVEYWETPFDKVPDLGQLRYEWESIKEQKDIQITCEVFSQDGDKYSIIWDLEYVDGSGEKRKLRGAYFITLNANNKCTYFFHCGELKK